MEVMSMVQKLEGNIPDFENAEVKVNATVTDKTVKIITGLLQSVGKLYELVHFRQSDNIKYVTFIQGEYFNIVVEGGLTSGYIGTGTNGLAAILQKTGLAKEESENIAYRNDEELKNAIITVKYF